MEAANDNTGKLKEFKSKFTKAAIDEYFGSINSSIAFFELQLIKLRATQKEIVKKFQKNKFLDSGMNAIAQGNTWMFDKLALLEMDLLSRFKLEIELAEAKIVHLKTIK